MKYLSDMLKNGCHFCKTLLAVETANCGTMRITLVGSDVWSEPLAIICCDDCLKRETERRSE